MARGESKISPRRIQAGFKQRQALELRMAGRTLQEIADVLGYASPTGAQEAIRSALKRTLRPSSDEFRALQLERLQKVIASFWVVMSQGNERAAMVVLRAIADIRALMGLDAIAKAEIDLLARIKESIERQAIEQGLSEEDKQYAIVEAERIFARR